MLKSKVKIELLFKTTCPYCQNEYEIKNPGYSGVFDELGVLSFAEMLKTKQIACPGCLNTFETDQYT